MTKKHLNLISILIRVWLHRTPFLFSDKFTSHGIYRYKGGFVSLSIFFCLLCSCVAVQWHSKNTCKNTVYCILLGWWLESYRQNITVLASLNSPYSTVVPIKGLWSTTTSIIFQFSLSLSNPQQVVVKHPSIMLLERQEPLFSCSLVMYICLFLMLS